ncbi:nuclease domain-containing protein [Massilia sp. CCM 8734]|uniref:nuclease domain-containing protein n=1 Tax=Massilia sp. CCM 8734 TaxID=2609283 RepID=UPI001E4331D9|nr:nuclease domain-containing protein [Massilia sp. CCM 8734]
MMRRSQLKQGAGLKHTAFKQKVPSTSTGILRVAAAERKAPARKAAMKKSRPKMMPIRKSAEGEACTLRFPCCCGDPATTVWAHSNSHKDGKGMGIKARDEEGCYACVTCHSWLDGGYAGSMPRSLVDRYFDLARHESQGVLRSKGLMKSESASVAPGTDSDQKTTY